MPIALGIDPGLAHVGLALVEEGDERDYRVLRVGFLKTTKGDGPVTGDDLRRYREIRDGVEPWMQSATVLGMEVYTARGKQSAGSATKTGAVYGMILGVAWDRIQHVHVMHPQQTRARLGLRQGADKQAIQTCVCNLVRGATKALMATPKGQREHVGDAIALALCALLQEGRKT